MKIIDHRLDQARQVPSPNCNERPQGAVTDLIVIHCISLPPKQYGNDCIERFFQNCLPKAEHPYFEEIHGMQVSSHLLIRRAGDVLQFVPFDKRAWHAGQSCHEGRENCNDFSIGIELEGSDDEPFEHVQYERLNQIIDALTRHYPSLNKQAIVGHSDIAPGRKTDPGTGFDWSLLNEMLGLS